jgi:protein-L-isoaspartate O-methyltransferase
MSNFNLFSSAPLADFSQLSLSFFDPQPIQPPPPIPVAAPPARIGNASRAERFRQFADGLQSKIDHAGRPMTQNPTPKRNREYQSRMIDCRNLERLQRALRALADHHQAGTVPASLAELRTKDEVSALVRKHVDSSKGGYYSCIECDDYADKTPAARLLQGMIDGNAAHRAERERQQKIGELDAAIALQSIPGYFPTPAGIVALMLERAELADGMAVLEPSAGRGNIADAITANYTVTLHTIELRNSLRELLTLKGYELVGHDFMQTDPLMEYDAVLMNPPFENGAAVDHVTRAFKQFLKPGGVLVAIMDPGFTFRAGKKYQEFKALVAKHHGTIEKLPEASFKQSGTGVSTVLVTMTKAVR